MFGGLDLKGSSGKETKKDEDTAPAPAASAFSFLSPSASSTPAPAATASSGFSFLNPSTEASSAKPPEPSAAAEKPKNEGAGEDAAAGKAPASSPFDFLQTPAEPSTSLVQDAPLPASSGFSFMTESSTKSVGSSAGDLSVPESNGSTGLEASATNGYNAPSGAGIRLSGAAVKKTVKKRTRTSRIGAGAQSIPSLPPQPPPMPDIPKPPPTADLGSVKNAAMEASRKAEQFMQEKHLDSIPAVSSVPSEEDDVVVAAKAAAAEAQQMQQQHRGSGRFKGLFRSRSPQTSRPTIGSSASSISVGSGASKDPVHERPTQLSDVPSLIVQHQPLRSSPPSVPPAPPKPTTAPPTAGITIPTITVTSAPDVLSTFIPKVETPMEKYEKILDEFSVRVKAHMDHMGQLRSHKTNLESERSTAAAKKRWSEAELEQAEAQQQAAVDTEDFERADELGSIISKHEASIAEATSIVQNIENALSQIEKQNSDAIASIDSSFGSIRTQLKSFEETQEKDEKDQEAKSALDNFSSTSKQLSAENERLQNDRKHLERDEELVVAERQELEKAITEQSGEYEKLRDEARSQLQETEAEMEALREELKIKQKLAAKLRTQAAGHDESVLKVRVKFARQINRVQKKEMNIKDNKEEWESEKNAFERQKDQHEAMVQAHSEQLLAREKLLQSLRTQVDLSTSLQDIVKDSLSADSSQFGFLSSDPKLEEEVVARRAAVSKCQHAVDAAKQDISTLQREIDFLQSDIPSLEDTKKEAAKRKDFKAASKASKDIKQATSRLAEARSEIVEAQSACDAADESCRVAQTELEASQEVATAAEKEAAESAVEQLSAQLKILQASQQQIDTNEEKGVPAVATYCLDSQMQALCTQGLALTQRYRITGFDDVFRVADKASTPTKATAAESSHPPLETIPSEAEVEFDEDPAPKPVDKKRLSEFLRYSAALQDLSVKQEQAAADEDYDTAAELEDAIQEVATALENLNLTDAEMEMAMSMPPEDAAEPTDDASGESIAAPAETEPETKEEAAEEEDVEPVQEQPVEVDGTVEESVFEQDLGTSGEEPELEESEGPEVVKTQLSAETDEGDDDQDDGAGDELATGESGYDADLNAAEEVDL